MIPQRSSKWKDNIQPKVPSQFRTPQKPPKDQAYKKKHEPPSWLLQKAKPTFLLSSPRLAIMQERGPIRELHLEDNNSPNAIKTRKVERRASDGPAIQSKENKETALDQHDRYIEFFKETLLKFKQEKQAEITSELFSLKLKISQLEQKLREEVKKNTEYRQQLRKTDGFIRKLGQILHSYRQKYERGIYSKESKLRQDEEAKEVPALEYLSSEINKVIHGHFVMDPKVGRQKSTRAKSEERYSELNYGFDFDPVNEADEDIFAIGNASSSGGRSRSPSSSSDEEEETQTQQKAQFSSEPIRWTPDDATNFCEYCHSEFAWYRWRHHCRMCGKLVCHDCSKYKDYVVGYSDNKVRTCKECHAAKETIKKKANQVTSIYSGNFNARRLRDSRFST